MASTAEPYGLRLCGELDSARHAVFADVLSAVVEAADGRTVHLDLAGLEFMDLGALAVMADVLARLAVRVPVVLDHLNPQLRVVLETVGWQAVPGVLPGQPASAHPASAHVAPGRAGPPAGIDGPRGHDLRRFGASAARRTSH